MEPLSALAISCAVMQIISFGHGIYKVVKAVSKDGSPDGDLKSAVAEMRTLSNTLQGHIGLRPAQQALDASSQRLLDLSKKCLDTSTAIITALDDIQAETGTAGSKKQGVILVVRQTGRWWKYRNKLKGWQRDLEKVKQGIETALLGDLWCATNPTVVSGTS
jgi:hypothetical protein